VGGGGALWVVVAVLVTLAREPTFRDAQALWRYEVTLPRPSVAAFQALATTLVGRAAAEADPARRAPLLDEADEVATAGLRYYQSIPWRPAPGTHLAAQLDYANLHVQLGRVAALRGEPLPAQIAHYRQSYDVAPTSANTLLLAEALLDQAAATGDEAVARHSLRYYGESLGDARLDVTHREQADRVLRTRYLRLFPTLAPAVETIRRTHLRSSTPANPPLLP
jgi:hypothetical protein